jgi:hypothetical protein
MADALDTVKHIQNYLDVLDLTELQNKDRVLFVNPDDTKANKKVAELTAKENEFELVESTDVVKGYAVSKSPVVCCLLDLKTNSSKINMFTGPYTNYTLYTLIEDSKNRTVH